MFTFDQVIYDKLMRYCSYQERAISEVKNKMRLLGVVAPMYDTYIKQLQDDNAQNELRFASSYAEGKMRIKSWGVRKVEMHLKQKQVSSEIIRSVLKDNADEQYLERLEELAERKLKQTKGKDDYERKSKVYRFLLQKGYESELIRKVLFSS